MLAEFIRSWPDVRGEMVLGAICTLCTGEPRESKEHHLGVRSVELQGFAVKLVDVACLERCLMLAGGVFRPSGADRPSPGLSDHRCPGRDAVDFSLPPLPGEASCRKDRHPLIMPSNLSRAYRLWFCQS